VQFFGYRSPEFLRLLNRIPVDTFLFLQALDVSVLAEQLRALELAVFVQDGIDVGFAIGHSLVCHVLVSPNQEGIDAVEILPCMPGIVCQAE
jgi:hypothetical protein